MARGVKNKPWSQYVEWEIYALIQISITALDVQSKAKHDPCANHLQKWLEGETAQRE